jgi:pimeloyl-ACP methyl ester carboxylesterase
MNNTNTENRYVQILSTGVRLEGIVSIPDDPKGIVLFVHGSGSSRHSSRNQFVAEILQEAGFTTLLFDLLTEEEELIDQRTRHLRFDIDLLARRTAGVLEWLKLQPFAYELKTGLFGASTGAAAALMAAADRPENVDAVVSRGGRPDLAGEALSKVDIPTLLIVGAYDDVVIVLNEEALEQMPSGAQKKLMIVPGATHLFEEPGTLEYAAHLARDWFEAHLDRVSVS